LRGTTIRGKIDTRLQRDPYDHLCLQILAYAKQDDAEMWQDFIISELYRERCNDPHEVALWIANYIKEAKQ